MSLSRGGQTTFGARLRARREALGWSLEKVGVTIGLDESSARARISRCELGVHEPSLVTVTLLSQALGAPEAYFYCRDDRLAEILLAASELPAADQEHLLNSLRERLSQLKKTTPPRKSVGSTLTP